uniref:Uncharacterized protein n=1 Tax=Arundo donax TaxID=35708 RepID=A0A0A9CRC3_ARUDO
MTASSFPSFVETTDSSFIGEAARRQWSTPRPRSPRRAPASGGVGVGVTAPVAMLVAAGPPLRRGGEGPYPA